MVLARASDTTSPSGTAVNDNRSAPALIRDSSRARVLTYGLSPRADVRAIDVKLDAQGRLGFRLVARGAEARVRLRVHGEHQVGDVLASVAVGLGYPLDAVAQALSDAEALSRDACTDARRSRTRAASHPVGRTPDVSPPRSGVGGPNGHR
ncbi:hypothetical protein [Micromonospora sp. NPDC004704]